MITENIIYLAEKENKSRTAYLKQMVSNKVMKNARISPNEMNKPSRYKDLLRLCRHIGIPINDLKTKFIAENGADRILNEIFCDKTEYGLNEIRKRCKELIDKKIHTSQMSLYALTKKMDMSIASLYEKHGYWKLQGKTLKKIVVYFLNNGMKKSDFMTEEEMVLENVTEVRIELHGLVFNISLNVEDRKKIILMFPSKVEYISFRNEENMNSSEILHKFFSSLETSSK